MADKKSFLIRVDAHTLDLLKRWADDELRSLNGQIEFLLKKELRASGRWKAPVNSNETPAPDTTEEV